MSSRKTSGFTIVELLVVITIIGILMALLFPAIYSAIRAARQANCTSNQREIGQAILIYAADGKGNFPKHLNPKTDASGNVYYWPWTANIMSQLGRGDIADAMQPGTGNPDPTTQNFRIDLLICPSAQPPDKTKPQLNHVANSGIEGLDDPIANGIFHQTNDVSLAYVGKNDGAATTLLIAENVDTGNWNDNSTAAADVNQTALVWKASATSGCDLNENTGGTCAGADAARPRSNHAGGFNATFCDGSVRFLSEEIGYGVYQLIMTPNGKALGQAPISEDQLNK